MRRINFDDVRRYHVDFEIVFLEDLSKFGKFIRSLVGSNVTFLSNRNFRPVKADFLQLLSQLFV